MPEEIRDVEYYQKKIELTPDQKKAWSQLVRAVNKCRKEKIRFYHVLEDLCGLNGNNVRDIGDSIALSKGRDGSSTDPNCLQNLDFPRVATECSFADDDHFVLLDDEVW